MKSNSNLFPDTCSARKAALLENEERKLATTKTALFASLPRRERTNKRG